VRCTGESSSSIDVTSESSYDDKPTPSLCITASDRHFTTNRSSTCHSETQSGDDFHICTQCEKRFSSHSGMRRHMNIHKDKYKCTECGKCCQSGHDLATHRRSHSGEKPFECTVCSKRFAQSGNLLVHSRIHSGEKPYKCNVCEMTFSQSEQLNTHMRVHTGDKPYQCLLCNKCYAHSCTLQRHKRHEHSIRRPHHCPYCGKRNTRQMYHVCIR